LFQKADEEDMYTVTDCPQADVLYDYAASEADMLAVHAGELVNVLHRGPEFCKVSLTVPRFGLPDKNKGWVPTTWLLERGNSMHAKAKEVKALHRSSTVCFGYVRYRLT
jgi:hypothetical protein